MEFAQTYSHFSTLMLGAVDYGEAGLAPFIKRPVADTEIFQLAQSERP
jgi:hypothetical protein